MTTERLLSKLLVVTTGAITPDGEYVYVTNSDDSTVSVITTASAKVSATIKVAGPSGAFGRCPIVPLTSTNAVDGA